MDVPQVYYCFTEWLVWFDETEGKLGLTLGVMFRSMQPNKICA